jgi:ABC-2 type transport system ATP-binding protein
MILVEGLTKRYGSATAVNNISFEVKKGDIVGFLGPNGAGKTTTMRMLTCFLPPSDGKASVAGFDVLEHPMEVKRRIGYLPETPPLYPEMEVREYVEFTGRIKGIASADIARRAGEVLERCALGDVRNKLIAKLSKGYRQRVGLAQALIHNPDVLILDEPTAGLDPKQIIETRKLIRSLAGEHTIILSTHILPEVSSTCESVIIINQGKLEAIDTPENLTSRLQGHETVYVDVEGPMDQVAGKLSQLSGVNRVEQKDGARPGRVTLEVEAAKDRYLRAEIATLVVQSGWKLHELRPVGLSLEDIFLKLTTHDHAVETAGAAPAAEAEASPTGGQE